jgi:hypothetical protein
MGTSEKRSAPSNQTSAREEREDSNHVVESKALLECISRVNDA